jgi:hypothetical protein
VIAVLVSFVSAKGAPGVTTSVLAVASRWFRPAVVVEADPFGGDIPAGLGRSSWPPDAGLLELIVAIRSQPLEPALRRAVFVPAPHSPPVLAGFGGLGQAAGVPWLQLASGFGRLSDADVLADCGRHALHDGVASLLAASDHVVVVSGSSLRAARASARLVPALQDVLADGLADPDLSVLVVRPGEPYSAAEVAQSCGLPVLGELPDDPRAARVWSDGAAPGRGFSRSALQREAAHVGAAMQRAVSPTGPGAGAPRGGGRR